MNKGTITIELPILDDVDQMEVVNTFNEKQLWYVCAIAKAFEKSQQELQRKDNIINELKKYLKLEIAEWQDVDNIPTRARVEEDKDILDKIKEIESK